MKTEIKCSFSAMCFSKYQGTVLFFGDFEHKSPCDVKVNEIIVPSLNFRGRHGIVNFLRAYHNDPNDIFVVIEMENLREGEYRKYEDFSVCLNYKNCEFAHFLNMVHKTFCLERWLSGLSRLPTQFIVSVFSKSKCLSLQENAYRTALGRMGRAGLRNVLPFPYEEKMFSKYGQFFRFN